MTNNHKLKASALLLFSIAILGAMGVGAAIGLFAFPMAAPPSLGTEQKVSTFSPTQLPFDDSRNVDVVLNLGAQRSLGSPALGRLTSLDCNVGAQMSSGDVVGSIDGATFMGLATLIPLWRDIAIGDQGPDISALQTELVRLGSGGVVDGKWGYRDMSSYDSLVDRIGVTTPTDDVVHISSIAWLPEPSVPVAECPGVVGQTVSVGQALARFPIDVRSARLNTIPTDVAAGERVLLIGGAPFPVSEEGTITDSATLAAITNSAEYAQMEDGANRVSFSYALATPIDVTVIPPSAIYNIEGAEACVNSNGHGVHVHVVGSRLGESLVIPEKGRILRSVEVDAPTTSTCG